MELILEISQLDLLRELQRNTSDRLTYQRLTTLIMIHRRMPVIEIADILGVDETTIYRHYNQYKISLNFESYLASHYKPCVGKLTQVQLIELKTYIQDNLCRNSNQDFDVFQQRIRDFFANIGNYKDELGSLINTKFQIIKPLHKDLQTSLR